MRRRDFLKKAGLVAFGVVSLGVVGEVGTDNLFGTKVIEYCNRWFEKPYCLKPIEIAGVRYYSLFLHSRSQYLLKVIVARDKYEHDRWVARYNRWAQTQEKPPFQMILFEGEVGAL